MSCTGHLTKTEEERIADSLMCDGYSTSEINRAFEIQAELEEVCTLDNVRKIVIKVAFPQ